MDRYFFNNDGRRVNYIEKRIQLTLNQHGKTEVSIVLPVYDEPGTIADLVEGIISVMSSRDESFEIVIVNDGSGESTVAVLRDVQKSYPKIVQVASHLENRGNGASLRTGIRIAQGEVVVTMDADGQHAPEDIPKLLELIPPNDLVIGARTSSYQGSWYRGWANRFYNRFASWLSRREVKDLTSGFRAMRRIAVEHFLPLFPDGFSAPTTTTLAFIKSGYNVGFLPIKVHQRKSGKSKISIFKDGSRFIIIIIRMVMLFDPLRIFFPVGVILFFLGSLAWIAGALNAERLVFPNSTIFLYSATILIWLLGLIADQLANTRITYHGDETVDLLSDEG
jgi:glycosyltransferase involved in cell wall biosynthesis